MHIILDDDDETKISNLSKLCNLLCAHVCLTMHLVALYEGLIILQVCARVSDVCPDIFVQIPGITTVTINWQTFERYVFFKGQFSPAESVELFLLMIYSHFKC